MNLLSLGFLIPSIACAIIAHAEEPTSPSRTVEPGEVVTVRIDAAAPAGTIGPLLYGLNTARWDESLFPYPADQMLLTCDRDAIRKVKEAGVTLLKYPGGNDADQYIWNDPENLESEMNTDEYYAFLRATGAIGFVTVNASESPELAAQWVDYCNRKHNYAIQLWEVGDEAWGAWTKSHAGGREYGNQFVRFARAMRAIDPSIKIAANMGLTVSHQEWNKQALDSLGRECDIITFTFFPLWRQTESDENLFAAPAKYRQMFTSLKETVKAAIPDRADTIKYCCVGYNSVASFPGPITLSLANGIYIGEMLGTFAETGTDMACLWALHNYYPPRRGDFGFLSSDGKNTPSYTYYVFRLMAHNFGGALLRPEITGGSTTLRCFASQPDSEHVSVVLLNKDPESAFFVTIALDHFQSAPIARIWRVSNTEYGNEVPSLPVRGQALAYLAPPYSVTAIEFIERKAVERPNLAHGAVATASGYSETGPAFMPQSAIDGNPYTRWASPAWVSQDGTDEAWLTIDLVEPRQVAECRIIWGPQFPIEFGMIVSEDGTRWHKIYQTDEGDGGTTTISFPPQTMRFIKIVCTKAKRAISTYSIIEVEVFGPEHTTAASN
jgi:hypothetical protein